MTDSKVRKRSQILDEASGVWLNLFEAPGIEGKPVQAFIPREDQQPNIVFRHLLQKGAALPPLDECREHLLSAVAATAIIQHRAARTGWRNGNRSFVSHQHVVGEGSDGSVIPPEGGDDRGVGKMECRGDLAGWNTAVTPVAYSTAMILALSTVYAAPLLALVNRPGFAIVLVGPSRAGKSTAQLVAASAMGFGAEEDLPTLNATHAGLLAIALRFNDHMLPINEVGTARGPKSQVYIALRDATYALMTGQDVLRHPAWSGASPGAPRTFLAIPLLSSEHSPDAWAARNGETRDEGETARMIGVPILATGHQTIFDLQPKLGSREAEEAWRNEQFQNLRQSLPGNRGVAFRVYVKRLVQNPDASRDRARYLIALFERKVLKPTMSAVARDIVAKFGVLFAGGVIAIEARVLPLEGRHLFRALRKSCRAALAELPDPTGDLRADLGVLKEHLASGAVLDLDASTRNQQRMMISADGYYEQKGEGKQVVIRSQVLHSWFPSLLRTRRVLEWLDEEGFLLHVRERSKARSNEWAQKQVTWPDGTRQRSISLYLPTGLTNLTLDR